MGDDMQTCANCRCAVPIDGEDGYLECHRHAVQVIGLSDDGGTCSGFPVTNSWDWCYEYVEGIPGWSRYEYGGEDFI